jgi:hypothetical protein
MMQANQDSEQSKGEALASENKSSEQYSAEQKHLSLKPENVEKGMAQLVLTLIELLRELLEKQAIRRMEAGELTDEQIERMGQTFSQLEAKMNEFIEYFGLSRDDLNIDLGPLGNLL